MIQKDAKYLKELEAQKKRQSVVINGLHKAAPIVNTRADNILELLFKQKIASFKSGSSKDVERTEGCYFTATGFFSDRFRRNDGNKSWISNQGNRITGT